MKRLLFVILIILVAGLSTYFFNQYWIHRYDVLVARQAGIYRLDPDLVWSVIYEETYFSPWKIGRDGEIGLMQVTPAVGREWAAETGMHEFERQMASDPRSILRDPERNIQIGCWYLEKLYLQFRDVPDTEPRMLAAYNAGPSRATEWNRTSEGVPALSGDQFIKRIEIPSTRAYVTSIMERYRKLKQERVPGSSTQQHSLLTSVVISSRLQRKNILAFQLGQYSDRNPINQAVGNRIFAGYLRHGNGSISGTIQLLDSL